MPVLLQSQSLDLAAWVASQREARPTSQPTPASISRPSPIPANSPGAQASSTDDRLRVASHAAAYLARIPFAVSGQRGHDRTFHAACLLIKGFGLSVAEARPLLRQWNEGCVPPWSERELEHKLQSADATADDRTRGYLLSARKQASGVGGKAQLQPRSQPGPQLQAQPQDPTQQQDRPPGGGSGGRIPPVAPASGPPCPAGHEANPHRLARLFLDTRYAFPGGTGLRFWHEEFHSWDGSAFRPVAIGEIRAQLSVFLADEFDHLYQIEFAAIEASEQSARRPPRPIAVTSRLVTDVLQAVAGLVLIKAADCPAQPAWIDGPPDAAAPKSWLATDILPARNVLVHLPSLLEQQACTIAPTPQFFNAFALDYDFVPEAQEPSGWLKFLGEIWPEDRQSVECLQEWFGYLLTADTRQQKILMMVGPKRSGRGTIARVLKALVGASNVANPTLATLARPFGLAPLIGKPVAIFPDARLSSRPDNAAIVESLLSISGEDDQTVDRKHLAAWTGRLPTRFVLISNELPRLKDASGALASRLVILRFTRSFYDREDTGLSGRLQSELPGILLWALEGWQRLRQRGRFEQPRSGRELLVAMEELGSPISAFLDDRCVLGSQEVVAVATLYEAWRSWCQEHGRDAVGDEPSFGRDLHAAIPGLSKRRIRLEGQRVPQYRGIRLRTALDPEAPTAD